MLHFAIMSQLQNNPTGSYGSLSEDFNYLYSESQKGSSRGKCSALSSRFLGLHPTPTPAAPSHSYYPHVQNPSETSVHEVCEM